MTDRDPTRLLRRCLRRVARGSYPSLPAPVTEVSADGLTILLAMSFRLAEPAEAEAPAEDAPPTGRPAAVPRDVLLWLRAHPSRHYSDILDAMTAKGHSRTQAAEALAKLVQLGLIEHAARGLPYRAAV